MSESFVDLSYRGLALGKRIKLTQVRPTSGYLEMPTPMPVGTTIAIATDDGQNIEAVVTAIREQVGGLTTAPGMVVTPTLEAAAETWWNARVDAPAPIEKPEQDKAPPAADAEGKVTVTSRRMSGQVAVPELIDDGRNTAVMEAVDADAVIADLPHDVSVRDTNPATPVFEAPARDSQPLIDDGKRTMAMDAVDLEALGLTSASGEFPAAVPEDDGDKPADSGATKAKKKRSKKR